MADAVLEGRQGQQEEQGEQEVAEDVADEQEVIEESAE